MLTDRQARFVEEYLVDRNATQAAIRAGYSAATAGQGGDQLLKNIEVKKLIDAATAEQSHRVQIDADRVLTEIASLAFYDVGDLVEVAVEVSPGTFKMEAMTEPSMIKRLPKDVRCAIIGWSWDRHGNFTLKLADKAKALDMLARHKSLYNDKLQVDTMNGLAERLERGRLRMRIDALPVDGEPEEPDTVAREHVEAAAPDNAAADHPIDVADRLRRARERRT